MRTKIDLNLEFVSGRDGLRWWLSSNSVLGLFLTEKTLAGLLENTPKALAMLDYLNNGRTIIARNILSEKEFNELKPLRRQCVLAQNKARRRMRQGDSRLIGDLSGVSDRLKAGGQKADADLVERARSALYDLGAVPLQWKKGESILGLKRKRRKGKSA